MNILTGMLKEQHREAGLYLDQDKEGFIYLKSGGKVLKFWHGATVKLQEIADEAEHQLKRITAERQLKLDLIHKNYLERVQEWN